MFSEKAEDDVISPNVLPILSCFICCV